VVLFTDWTLLRLFPPLRAVWSRVGQQALVPVTGQNAKRVLFGAINVQTGHRVVLCRKSAGGAEARAFLAELRRRYRKAGTIWLLLDRAPAHTDAKTLRLAGQLGIDLVWLPKQWPELNAMDHLWKELKRLIAVNRQAAIPLHINNETCCSLSETVEAARPVGWVLVACFERRG
jgi:transposase